MRTYVHNIHMYILCMYVCVLPAQCLHYYSVCSIDHRATMNSSTVMECLACGYDGMCIHKGGELYCRYIIFLKIDHISLCIYIICHSTKGSGTTEGLMELPCPASWGEGGRGRDPSAG